MLISYIIRCSKFLNFLFVTQRYVKDILYLKRLWLVILLDIMIIINLILCNIKKHVTFYCKTVVKNIYNSKTILE